MDSRCNPEKNSMGPNQPHSREVKDSTIASKKPFEVPSEFTGQYPPKIPTKPTLDPSYTSSLDIPHQDSSSNEEIQGVSSK
jgi:hypothetical protein